MIPTADGLAQVSRIAQHGSPVLLQAVGRIFGVGPEERRAFGQEGGGIPTWTWVVLAVGVGFIAGARIERRWPNAIPAEIAGD